MSTTRFTSSNAFPPVIKNLLIVNVLVFIAQQVFANNENISLENTFALHDLHSVYFKPWQLLTHMFMHGGYSHILFNMFALWMFGRTLENVWGGKRFLFFYIMCGLGAALLHLGVLYYEMEPIVREFNSFPPDQQDMIRYAADYKVNVATLGASGAVFGCLAAFGYLFPDTMIYLYFFLPLKAKWFVIIYAAIELWLGVSNSAGDEVAHFAHLGGAITGFIIVFIWNKTNRQTLY
jgi:membrane associated rhomboid family serine protease